VPIQRPTAAICERQDLQRFRLQRRNIVTIVVRRHDQDGFRQACARNISIRFAEVMLDLRPRMIEGGSDLDEGRWIERRTFYDLAVTHVNSLREGLILSRVSESAWQIEKDPVDMWRANYAQDQHYHA
jgi:hypothetical protein